MSQKKIDKIIYKCTKEAKKAGKSLDTYIDEIVSQFEKFNFDKVKIILGKNTISKALDINKDLNRHKEFKKACDSCNPMLEHFNIIEDVTELKI
ncbi:hypothetical protein [Flavobacterium sp. NRK F7]|uniref:hypothetical protein n=1 Tax=Flavobacterium sp. NRK F7 TaxID=2954930 RepID=UPI002090C7FE|nr:hypothetical protein [Flavobacterium sp. NRK F7]MCO6161665.1 hypothetical protein [Flavobacterium sp. NRK F7]